MAKRKSAKSGIHMPHVSQTRARATRNALKREPTSSATPAAIGRQARAAAARRGPSARHASAMKAVRTKRREGLLGGRTSARSSRRRR